jgi:uncharacterized RDD family membrane protein YckC
MPWCYSAFGSLLAGVHASAAQNAPVTKTCFHCGAVLPANVRICSFCESTLSPAGSAVSDEPWRSELSERLASYRARRKKTSPNDDQSQFTFDRAMEPAAAVTHIAVAEPHVEQLANEDFSFTIAIGRCAPSKTKNEVFIDVSTPEASDNPTEETGEPGTIAKERSGLYPVASMEERRFVALIDAACLLFAYGGFLTLFGSLGGQFTFSKMSAAVYCVAFAIVYLQYFALFTVFGGTTPGMMLRGVQVVDFSGETPSPRKLLLRAAGYMLSAGTFFLGFLWAMWDEDELTWHDRISRTYLSSAEKLADSELNGVIHGHS